MDPDHYHGEPDSCMFGRFSNDLEEFLGWWEADIEEHIDMCYSAEVWAAMYCHPLLREAPIP